MIRILWSLPKSGWIIGKITIGSDFVTASLGKFEWVDDRMFADPEEEARRAIDQWPNPKIDRGKIYLYQHSPTCFYPIYTKQEIQPCLMSKCF